MHGFFRGARATAAFVVATCATLALATGCAKTIPQDRATGEDGRQKGAKVLELEDNATSAKGIVTYPGGDRVDWRVVELPPEQVGTLAIKLSWAPPRPRLRLGVDVFDEWGKSLLELKGKKGSSKRSISKDLEGARGKLYLRIYAVDCGDAGAYKLALEFTPSVLFDPKALDIPKPPALPAVPAPPVPCDPDTFDKKNPACKSVCPTQLDPSWPACQGKCPAVPDVNNPACQATMPCPNPPDRRVKSCPKSAWPECDLTRKDPQNPNCDGAKAKPVKGKVTNVTEQSDGVVVTINRGSEQGVDVGWTGRLLRSDGKTVDGSQFKVTRVGKRESVGKIRLQTDTITSNPTVELSPP